eukprot:1189709-Prorocentrum_minimum.AAC.2
MYPRQIPRPTCAPLDDRFPPLNPLRTPCGPPYLPPRATRRGAPRPPGSRGCSRAGLRTPRCTTPPPAAAPVRAAAQRGLGRAPAPCTPVFI